MTSTPQHPIVSYSSHFQISVLSVLRVNQVDTQWGFLNELWDQYVFKDSSCPSMMLVGVVMSQSGLELEMFSSYSYFPHSVSDLAPAGILTFCSFSFPCLSKVHIHLVA